MVYSKHNYPQLIEEDFFIRQKVEEIFNEFLTISNIEINRIDQHLENKEYVNITIYALFQEQKKCIVKLQNILLKQLKTLQLKPYQF